MDIRVPYHSLFNESLFQETKWWNLTSTSIRIGYTCVSFRFLSRIDIDLVE